MQCPNCQTTLSMTDRQGIEIDYCPQCRGVWLDRGELDKLIERSNQEATPQAPAPPANDRLRPEDGYRGDDRYRNDDRYRPKRKKSLWGEIFDFD